MAIPIIATKTTSGNTPKTKALIEKAGQTYLAGVPLMIEVASGSLIEWSGANIGVDLICGISAQDGSNLSATGAGAPGVFAPITGVGSALTYGSVQNMAAAKIFGRGGPVVDGRGFFFAATEDIVFEGQVGPAQTTVVTDVGVKYGMTKDADNHWYIDRTKTGANAVVTIVGLEPNDGPKLAGRVLFTFIRADVSIVA